MNESKDMIVAPEVRVQRSEEAATLDRLQTVKAVLAPDLTNNELELFAMVAVRSGLDPFARQIYAVKRAGKMTIQTGIDGYRSIAARTGEYDGQDEPTYGPDCGCGKAPRHPESSTVRVYRKGMSRAVAATAFWHEYVPDPGPSGKGDQMWRKMPHVMIAKVAEALALRKAFPWDPSRGIGIGSDVYTTEEMAQAENPAPVVVSVQDRVAARAEAVSRPGISLRDFAQAVVGMEPEIVRAVRNEMYPDGRPVSELGDDERAALLHRLQQGPVEEETEDAAEDAPTGTPPVQPSQSEPPEEIEGEAVEIEDEPVGTDGVPMASGPQDSEEIPPMPLEKAAHMADGKCPVNSPLTGDRCDREKGHKGRHRSGDLSESW